MDIEEMLAREEIRQLMAAYNMAGDSMRREEFGEVFATDAVLTTTGLALQGRQAIVEGIFSAAVEDRPSGPRPHFVRHHLATSSITFPEPGRARGRSYFQVITDIGLDHAGVYMDEFRREEGAWKIAKRNVKVEYHAPNGYFGG